MKTLNVAIWAALGMGASFPVFAQGEGTPKYVCEAGVTIPKHLQSYLGDASWSLDEATESALETCEKESALSDFCHLLSCYIEESALDN